MERENGKERAARIGIVNLCHQDYRDSLMERKYGEAKALLERAGAQLFAPDEDVYDFEGGWRAGRELAGQDLAAVVLFLGSWTECSTVFAVLREIEHLPLMLWGFPMFAENGEMCSTGSYVSFAMVAGSMERADYRFARLLQLPDEGALPALENFIRAAWARQSLKREKIGLIGYTSMSIYPGTFDHLLLHRIMGPEVEHLDSYSLIRLAEEATANEIDGALTRLGEFACMHRDVSEDALRKSMGIYVALSKICKDHNWAAFTIKCQYEFSKEYAMVPCVPVSLMAEENVVAGCEGDMLCAVSMLILARLSGETVAYGDAIHHEGNVLKLSSCGMLPFSMGCGERTVRRFMPHDGFTGIQNSFVMRPERVTILRLIERRGTYALLYATGQGQETELRQGYMPALDVLLDGDMEELVANYGGQHFAIAYGDHGEALHALAAMMDLEEIRI